MTTVLRSPSDGPASASRPASAAAARTARHAQAAIAGSTRESGARKRPKPGCRSITPITTNANNSHSHHRGWPARPSISRDAGSAFMGREGRRGPVGFAERGGIPSATEGLDERDARGEAGLATGEQGLRIAERDGLRRTHRGVGHGPRLVLIEGELHGELGVLDGLLLHL